MKTNSLPLIAFLVAIAAFALLPVSAVAASVAFSVTGMISVFTADYGRKLEPARVSTQVIAFDATRAPSAEFRDAA
ncbi:MAG TPA: hypothetical protein VN775_09920 [Opitutaceae bacterium]|nr:hypothetical protein [Opitutaceae bacterium]